MCSSSKDELQAVLDHLRRKFEITVVDPKFFLGFEIKRNRLEKSLSISQTYYIKKVLERFGMSDAKPASTPADPSVRLCREGTRDNPQSEKVTAPYREIMGSLNYAMIGTRPDIAFAVGLLSRFNRDPRMPHYAAAKTILSYLKGTADVGLLLGKRQSEKENRSTCYVDSSYADDFDTRRSTSGFLMMYNDAPVIWKSRLQSMVTHSTTEAEFIAASYACKQLRQLLHELNRDEALATPIHIDNQGALKLIANRQVHARTKHLDIRYMSIRELEANGVIETKYIGTEKQLADLLTKALYRDRFSIPVSYTHLTLPTNREV